MRLAGPVGPGTRVLDVGCGNGFWAGRFAALGCEVVGIEPGSSGIELARKTYPDVRFEQMGAGPTMLQDLGEAPFDVIVSTEVIEHLYSPEGYAQGCFDALRPGGTFVMSTPYHGRLKDIVLAVSGKMDFHHDALREGGHIKFFSRRILEELLVGRVGFRDFTFVGAGRVPYVWKSMVVSVTRP